ncbi:MAG TPA: hypothetical protein VGH76_06155 [Actinomycetospora sp.]
MRITLSLDDDVLLAVEERAASEKRTAGEVLPELARAALTDPAPTSRGLPRVPSSPPPRAGRPRTR